MVPGETPSGVSTRRGKTRQAPGSQSPITVTGSVNEVSGRVPATDGSAVRVLVQGTVPGRSVDENEKGRNGEGAASDGDPGPVRATHDSQGCHKDRSERGGTDGWAGRWAAPDETRTIPRTDTRRASREQRWRARSVPLLSESAMATVTRRIVVDPPRGGPPLYEWLSERLRSGQPAAVALPDQPEPGPDELRWEPGALDGLMTHHAGVPESSTLSGRLCDLILRACERPSRRCLWRLHEALAEHPALEYLDALLEELVQRPWVDPDTLREVGLWLATCGTQRDPVKVGIGLIGISGVGDARGTLLVLGRSDEFTLYVAVAFANTADDPEGSLWELAQHVEGWGRIHAVERLAHTRDPGIKAWLLREGYRNTVSNEYLAFVAATTGELARALEARRIDDALRRGAGDMIRALLSGGPAENMDDYHDGAAAVSAYLRHVDPPRGRLDDFVTVAAISDHLADAAADWDRRAARGWSATVRQWMESRCAEVLAHQHWARLAVEGLSATDDPTVERAHAVARRLHVNTFEIDLGRLQQRSLDPKGWQRVLSDCPVRRLEEVLDIARRSLPLRAIASGPGHDLGLGSEHVPHGCLSVIVQALCRYPGHGWDLIAVALQSPVTHNRNAALCTLTAWGRDAWPPDVREVLEDVRHREPLVDTRDAIETMLTAAG